MDEQGKNFIIANPGVVKHEDGAAVRIRIHLWKLEAINLRSRTAILHKTHNEFLDKFKELNGVKLGTRNVCSDLSIHRKSGHEEVPVSTYKDIFQPRLIARVGTPITFCIHAFILAGLIDAYKL